ncbi:MAG: hypothetical protein H0U57_06420 [Tatlockia sp.]|nr:hypothetical protein [Tatlockia sp.]
MFKKIIGIAALAFSFALSQSAFADSSICGEGMKKMVESLNLDSSQKEKIKPIMEQLKSTMQASVEQMKEVSNQMNQQASSGSQGSSAAQGSTSEHGSVATQGTSTDQSGSAMQGSTTDHSGTANHASSSTMDQGSMDALVDRKTKIIGDMMKAKMAAKQQIFGILNDQQKTQFQSKMKDAEEKMIAKFKECHED